MATDEEILQYLSKGVPQAKEVGQTGSGGASDDEILKYLTKGIPQPTTTPATVTTAAPDEQYTGPLRAFMLGVGAVNDVIPTVLGTPGNLEALYNKYVVDPIVGGKPGNQVFPTSEDIKKYTDAIHFTGNKRAIPGMGEYPNLEKYGTAAITGAVSALPYVVTGAAPLTLISSGVGSGVAAEAAHELAPDWPILQLLAGVVGGTAGGAVGGAASQANNVRQMARKLAAAEEGVVNTQAAYGNAQIENPLLLKDAKDVIKADRKLETGNVLGVRDQTVEQAQAVKDTMAEQATALRDAMDMHIEGEKVKALAASEAKVQNSLAGADKTFEDVASAHGTARSEVDAGKAIQAAVRDWLGDGEVVGTSFPKQIAKQRDLQDAAVPGNTPTPLNPFLDTLKNITSEGGNLDAAEKLLRPHLPEQLKSVFDNLLESPGMLKGKPAVTETSPMVDSYGNPITKVVSPEVPAKPVTWNDTKKLVTALGDARGDYKIVNDLGKDNVNRLYAALQDSRGMAAADVGAKDIFESTNAEMNRIYQIAEGPASRVVKGKNKTAQDPNPENVVKALDPTDLEVLRGEMPGAVNQVTAAHLRGEKAWQGLTEQERNVLVPDPAHRAALDSAIAAKESAPEVGKAEQVLLEAQAKDAKATNEELAKKTIEGAKKQEVQISESVKNWASGQKTALKEEATGENEKNSLLLTTDQRLRARLVQQAKDNLRDIKSQIAENDLASRQHSSLMGLLSGESAGEALGSYLGLPPLVAKAIGAGIGSMLPYGARGIRNIPLSAPLVGGAIGTGNPLLPDISFTAPGRTSQ